MKLHTLTVAEVLLIHSVVIDETGGTHGIRDQGLLQSATEQILQTFSGKDLYPSLYAKAAALFLGLLKNHPFVDGNKRTALVSLGIFLELNGHRLKAEQEVLSTWVEAMAAAQPDHPAAVRWIKSHASR